MRYIYLVILLILTSCELFAQDSEHELIGPYNTDIPGGSYGLYVVELEDTTLTPFVSGGNSDLLRDYFYHTYNQDSLKTVDPDTAKFTFINPANGKYLQCALIAIKVSGAKSPTAVSNFLKKDDLTTPLMPGIYKLRKE